MNDNISDSHMHLCFSSCKECGECCFDCGFLNKLSGCQNEEYRLNSRCTSFPILYGNPEKMGHNNLWGNLVPLTRPKEKQWFLIEFDQCLLLQSEKFFHQLRWILEDINNGREMSGFVVSFDKETLTITYQ